MAIPEEFMDGLAPTMETEALVKDLVALQLPLT